MKTRSAWRTWALATTVVVVASVLLAPAAGASVTRTKGQGQQFWVSWTEYDPDDTLRLPGNVHVGNLNGTSNQWGTHLFGFVSDFECDPGEVPHGGGHLVAKDVVDTAARTAEAAAEAAVDEIVESGAASIDAATVANAIQSEIAAEVPQVAAEELPCDYLGDRWLDGPEVTFTVDPAAPSLRVTGTLIVTGGHGEGPVLGRPPIDMTVTGGQWSGYEWSFKSWGPGYKFSDSTKGTDYSGGVVTGAIGAMGFADDPDDTSYASFGTFTYKTVERVRN